MSSIESTGKTIKDAVQKGLFQLGKKEDEVMIEVVTEPSHGFLGIGSKMAVVRLTVIEEQESVTIPAEEKTQVKEKIISKEAEVTTAGFTAEEAAEKAKAFLQDVLKKMDIGEVFIEKMIKSDKVILHLHGNNLGILIGKHGQTLDALQYLTNLTTNQGQDNRYFLMLDVENYRQRRKETLEQLAVRLASRVKHEGDKVMLEPMNGYERKIIHMALQNKEHVRTESEGQDPYRHVVIYYN
ncbi:MAG: protein jag [Megasphaera sp.]|jgi:spoIIIJ-associated protein|uniref:RNA-binding cell elongation regulator Jag/EloR n=1 Tax=Megasphaera sueciensis TaxID=349094 RepID=UPI003CFC37F0|nr:protein jag [Megasphaera sp.]MCI1823503.1 protein jag [Megasphaera sp.]